MPTDGHLPAFGAVEPARLARVEHRLQSAAGLWACAPEVTMEARFAEDLEDLDSDASTAAAEALLDRIARARAAEIDRRGASLNPSPGGRFVLYRLAQSLETGEAEIASRGFFDVRDRPPLILWLEVVSRMFPLQSGAFDVAVLAFVPKDLVRRAEAGRRACVNGSLSFLDEAPGGLANQLLSLLGERAATRSA